jgi:hypothetical protein
MSNIASTETSSFDVSATVVPELGVHVTFRLNEDGMGDTEIDYVFDQYDLENLIDYLTQFKVR